MSDFVFTCPIYSAIFISQKNSFAQKPHVLGGMQMSVYDREWYKKDAELRRRRQEGADAMWNEVEPSRPARQAKKSQNQANTSGRPKPPERIIPTVCPRCYRTIQIHLGTNRSKSYTFICPLCGAKTSVRTITKTDRVITGILYALGIPAVALIVFAGIDTFLKLFM